MMSAQECLRKADHCEQMARSLWERSDRNLLLETAKIWRVLAKAADRSAGVGQLAADRPGPD